MAEEAKNPKYTYSEAEQIVLDNAEHMLKTASNLVYQAKLTIAHAWGIKRKHDESQAKIDPYKDLISMLNYYIDQAKAEFSNYCQENGVKTDNDSNTKEQSKGKKVIPQIVQKHKII